MRFGVCTGIENAEVLAGAGFDYLELPLAPIAEMAEGEFAEMKARVSDSPLKPEVFNIFFPRRIVLTGEEVDMSIVSEYVKRALGRAAKLGAGLAGIGSGGSRRVPEGFPMQKAMSQLREVFSIAAAEATALGMLVMVEPLRSQETNIINTGAQGLELLDMVNHNAALLELDFYHMASEGESSDIVLKTGKARLGHCHIANPDGRVWPKNPQEADYAAFFQALRKIEYEGRMSIEGKCDDMAAEAAPSLSCLKQLAG